MDYIQNNYCESCKSLVYSPLSSDVSFPERDTSNMNNVDGDGDLPSIIPSDIANRFYRVEIELTGKKPALTQALYDNQELTCRLQRTALSMNDLDNISVTGIRSTNQNSTGGWLSKTVNSIKEAANASNRTKVN